MSSDADTRSTVLVLGDFAHEGLSAKIESQGYVVINKRFRSSAKNWLKIADLIRDLKKENRLALIFGYIPTPTLLLIADGEYDGVREDLFAELTTAHTIFFVYEQNLEGTIEPLPWELSDLDLEDLMDADEISNQVLTGETLDARKGWLRENEALVKRALAILDHWAELGIEVLPFKKRSDVTIRMFEAIEDVQAGVFLRLYVPHGRYQSEQLEDFLTLFTRYLRNVEGKEFSIDQQRTSRGTTYVFKGRGDAASVEDLQRATERFDNFLILTENEPEAAERLLAHSGAPKGDVAFIVAKFARSFRRLRLEVKHDFQRRHLSLKQEMEAELLDATEGILLPVPSETHLSTLFSVVGNSAPVTINLTAGAISQNAKASIGSIINGGIDYTEEDGSILALIAEIKDDVVALQLRSDLDRLKDPATSPEEQRTAVQKLKGFLYKVGRKVDHVATEVLVAYLNSQISPSS
ncbi:hypothetical protein [Luteolibacter sp. Populi]|uniref:hypothetical protein n=1 Tax=Luteolibacter sp. Populi TaxID=3230487 RepID=UPI003466082B